MRKSRLLCVHAINSLTTCENLLRNHASSTKTFEFHDFFRRKPHETRGFWAEAQENRGFSRFLREIQDRSPWFSLNFLIFSQICRYWLEHGRCEYGSNVIFHHFPWFFLDFSRFYGDFRDFSALSPTVSTKSEGNQTFPRITRRNYAKITTKTAIVCTVFAASSSTISPSFPYIFEKTPKISCFRDTFRTKSSAFYVQTLENLEVFPREAPGNRRFLQDFPGNYLKLLKIT